ncbi:beta-galactosidase [Paenibacillus turpanensis]|uniref:beta-galactosidase n=1 Tax=Paenibacillus turpanensis TaxID=2689078 RepID=UPI001407C598|nr:beta-galactosidase [Paenibacillus turpanensis]
MKANTETLQPIQLSSNAIEILGSSDILLCASLFYFRIPQALWRERMEQLKQFGYNCIDVYFPWNYHEPKEGQWDFSGEKDVEAFLQEAAESGLWVVARPGPYICSEWDGGALPAYLNVIEGIKLRDHNPVFLNYVSKWFDRILPVLRRYQVGAGGTVICVQLENELDFYGCSDPNGYISSLRDMAASHGITVPLIACAGQGGLREASGLAEGVVPTCNFYPNDLDPSFEEKVIHYQELLASMGLPLLVTETNRSHFLLRRLLSCGVKLLGPYLQVSGTDFGFTNGTNNWGEPLSFMTSDYDFGGMISPEGHVRPEAYEGKMLRRLIETYGPSLTEAEPSGKEFVVSAAAASGRQIVSNALRLKDGGELLFLSNVGEQAEEVRIQCGRSQVPQLTSLQLERGRSVALPCDVPMECWGIEGTLLYATAELFLVKREEALTTLLFHTDHEGEISLRLPQPSVLDTTHISVQEQNDTVTLTFHANETAACTLQLSGGRRLKLITMNRSAALMLEEVQDDGTVRFEQKKNYRTEAVDASIQWSLGSVPPEQSMAVDRVTVAGKVDHLEHFSIYRGFAWYEAVVDESANSGRLGIFMQEASDVISLYSGNEYVTTVAPGGSSCYIPLEENNSAETLTVRAEIWGHTNFDDLRLPGLRLHALKGIGGLVSVNSIKELSQNWRVQSSGGPTHPEDFTAVTTEDPMWPVVSFGGWLSSDRPANEYYHQSFTASRNADSWILHFKGIQAEAALMVNGKEAGRIDPSNPFAVITPFVRPGERVHITLYVKKSPGAAAGKVMLFEGTAVTDWTLSSCQEEQLWAHAGSIPNALPVKLPMELKRGDMAWLLGELQDSNEGKGWRVKAAGANLKLSVLFNEQLVGRLWLPGSPERPRITGGSADSFYLPGPWFKERQNKLAILLEAVQGEGDCRLEGLSFLPV